MLTWLQSQEENENHFQIISTKIPAGILALRGYTVSLYYGENSAAYAGYDNARDKHAAEDNGEGYLHADVKQGGNKRARPCSGSREGNGDQYKQAQQLVLENQLRLFLLFWHVPFHGKSALLSDKQDRLLFSDRLYITYFSAPLLSH